MSVRVPVQVACAATKSIPVVAWSAAPVGEGFTVGLGQEDRPAPGVAAAVVVAVEDPAGPVVGRASSTSSSRSPVERVYLSSGEFHAAVEGISVGRHTPAFPGEVRSLWASVGTASAWWAP